jgi:hypothetical protein
MNGATGVLWEKIINTPKRTRMIIIGIIHHIFSFQKKERSSRIIEARFRKPFNMVVNNIANFQKAHKSDL